MIRAAISPIIQRRRRNIFVATCGATFLAVPLLGQDSRSDEKYAKCSSLINGGQLDDSSIVPTASATTTTFDSLALNRYLDDIEKSCSLILPTMEALLRAARLAKTAVVMAADYKVYYLRRKNPNSFVGQMYSLAFPTWGSNNSNNHLSTNEDNRDDRLHLENTIDQLERELERAQHEYVKPTSSSSNNNNNNHQRAENSDSTYADDAAHESTSTLSKQTLAKRELKEAMLDIANQLATAQEALSSMESNNNDMNNSATDYGVHRRNAHRLLELLRTNGGVYIKVGQHLANLDLLLPEEYIQTLSSLFDDAPVSSYEDVCHVVKEELGSLPSEIFNEFSETPFASASLAQVHTAKCKETGRNLAIKVQHKGLRETSKGDLFAMGTVVSVAERMFDDFNFGWICEELTPQLPKELDFNNEGKNAEAAAAHLRGTGLDCVVPNVYWNSTSDRVLTMEFEEGFRATDIENIDKAGICRRDVARLISSVFNSQIFDNGFVHCDPHEANVLLREHPNKKGKPQIVLVDHGLYKTLDSDFQEAYARLWKGIVMADVGGIKSACGQLGVHKMYPLLAAMLTSRPFDEVVERSQTRSLDAAPVNGGGDKAVIRGYAQRYLKEIITMLDIVPRQMLLIFKMNDCLRHVDMALGSPVNNLVVAGRYASKRVYESDQEKHKQTNGGVLGFLRSWMSYIHVLIRINSYEMFSRLSITQ